MQMFLYELGAMGGKHMRSRESTGALGSGSFEKMRNVWVFTYPLKDILKAAKKRVAHHKKRLGVWEKEYKQAETRLKAKGIEYRPQLASGLDGPQLSIVGDTEMMKRISFCKDKIQTHTMKLDEYESWVRALSYEVSRDANQEVELQFDDVCFFGL